MVLSRLNITKKNKFRQNERLRSQKKIALLFKEGKKVIFYPIRLIYIRCANQKKSNHQICFSIAKHRVKRAVARNKIKRVLRETYRLHKHIIYDLAYNTANEYFLIAYVYIGGKESNYITIQEQLIHSLFYLKSTYCRYKSI